MSNDTNLIHCPYCQEKLVVETSWQGMKVNCSFCNRDFIVQIPDNTPVESYAAKNERSLRTKELPKKKDYPWGRGYIFLARIFAILGVVSTLICMVALIFSPFSNRHKELKRLENNDVPVLVKKQKLFQDEFIKAAQLVMLGNNSKARFNFPLDTINSPGYFNEKLESAEDVKESLAILAKYESKISLMSERMNVYFSKQYNKISRLLNRGNAMPDIFSNQSDNVKNGYSSLTFGQDVQFYVFSKKNVSLAISNVHENLRFLEGRTSNHDLNYQKELEFIESGINFIQETLNAHQRKIPLGQQRYEQSETKSSFTGEKIGQDQFLIEKQVLAAIVKVLSGLSSYQNWLINTKAKTLSDDLHSHLKKINAINENLKKELKLALYESLKILLVGLFAAFMLMVLADYLSAHFDSAVALKSLVNKMKINLFLPLLTFFLLAGCGKNPLDTLKEELAVLKMEAVNSCLAEKINKAPDATAYLIPGKELILISGGIKKVSGSPLTIGSRYYNVIHVVCTAKVSHSPVQEHLKKPYSHKAQLRVNVDYLVKSSGNDGDNSGVPGVIFNSWVPDSFNSAYFDKEKWYRKCREELPVAELDHAAAIYNVSRNQGQVHSENKIFDILYNTENKKWELKDALIPQSITVPPVYSAAKLEQSMKNCNYRRFTVETNGKKVVYWFKVNDYEIADKIFNKGLIKVNGVWKRKRVVEQTLCLSIFIATFKDKKNINLTDIKTFLLEIQKNKEAENKDQACTLAETALIKKCQQFTKLDDVKMLLKIVDLLNQTPARNLINYKKIARFCMGMIDCIFERKIDASNKYLRKIMAVREVVESFKASRDWLEFERKIEAFYKFNESNEYFSILKQLYVLKEIIDGKQFSINSVLNRGGKCGKYHIVKNCTICGGSGKKDCRSCKNSGICALCKGKGGKYIIEKKGRGGSGRVFETKKLVRCAQYCTFCDARNAKCPTCSGKGIVIDKKMTDNAFEKTFSEFEQEIAQIFVAANQLKKQYENARKKNLVDLQKILNE